MRRAAYFRRGTKPTGYFFYKNTLSNILFYTNSPSVTAKVNSISLLRVLWYSDAHGFYFGGVARSMPISCMTSCRLQGANFAVLCAFFWYDHCLCNFVR